MTRVHKSVFAALLTVFAQAPLADACTTFALGGSKIVAKSYDWHIDMGHVLINKRGVEKQGLALKATDRPPTWTSKYGSVTLNQYGREFPNSGLNEAGLTVEVMVLEESEFPVADATESLNEVQWVQYQLDNYATVAEVLAHAGDLRISEAMAPLHYMACDRSGACAAIEFLDGAAKITAGGALSVQVLANDTFAASRDHLDHYVGFGGTRPIPTSGLGSLTRFVRAADHVRQAPATGDAVAYAFQGLGKVAGSSTQWRVVYETARGIVHFASLGAPAVKSVSLTGLDLSCASPALYVDMGRASGGDATAALAAYDEGENRALVHASLSGQLPDAVIARAVAYPETTTCVAP